MGVMFLISGFLPYLVVVIITLFGQLVGLTLIIVWALKKKGGEATNTEELISKETIESDLSLLS